MSATVTADPPPATIAGDGTQHEPRLRPRGDLRDGAMAIAPLLIGFAPYAVVVGSVIGAHSAPAAGWAGIWLIFGGGAHLATLQALDDDGSALLAALTGLLVNARLLVYSASLAGRWRNQPRWFRFAAAPFIVDPTWLVADQRPVTPDSPAAERRYFFGAALALAAVWGTLVTFGMLLGSHAGSSLGLDVAVPLCLSTLVAPRLTDRPGLLIVATTGVVAVLTAGWPAGSGLLVAIAAGTIAGGLASRRPS